MAAEKFYKKEEIIITKKETDVKKMKFDITALLAKSSQLVRDAAAKADKLAATKATLEAYKLKK